MVILLDNEEQAADINFYSGPDTSTVGMVSNDFDYEGDAYNLLLASF